MHRRTKNENDMEKVSRSIFYKEKVSLRDFLGKEDTLERDFLDKLRKRPFMQNLEDVSVNILRLFNNACYICTLVYEEDYPLLELNEYERIAIDKHDDPIWTDHMFPATMALVVCWLRSDECLKISEERGRQKDIEELCKAICLNIEECNALPNEGIEDFHTLISNEHRHPSDFIEERSFLRRPLAEVVEDKSVKGGEVFDSLKYLADIIKNNPDEFLIAFGPDSYFSKQLSNMSFNEAEMKSRLAEWYKNKRNDDKEEPTVIEQAFNMQTGLPCFTSRQMTILLTAVGRITEIDNPPGKTTLGDIVQRIAGYQPKTASQNMKGMIPEKDKKIVADILMSKFPRLASEVMKVT